MISTIAVLVGTGLIGIGGAAPCCTVPVVTTAPASDYMYTFTTRDQSGSRSTGVVRVHGDRTRIEMHDNGSSSGYLLFTDHGTKMLSVHPDREEAEQMDTPDFEQIIGTSLRRVSSIVKFRVVNGNISYKREGPAGKLLGYDTQRVRITESFDLRVRAMGFDGGTKHHTIVTDYWVSPGLDLGRNPLLTLLEHASAALARTDEDFADREQSVRSAALTGTPLRTVVTETTVDRDGDQHVKTRSVDITAVTFAAQPPALFDIPPGYRIKRGDGFSM